MYGGVFTTAQGCKGWKKWLCEVYGVMRCCSVSSQVNQERIVVLLVCDGRGILVEIVKPRPGFARSQQAHTHTQDPKQQR